MADIRLATAQPRRYFISTSPEQLREGLCLQGVFPWIAAVMEFHITDTVDGDSGVLQAPL
jgi:hypothetical protein